MDYLDYLPHTPYHELPAAIRETVAFETYEQDRQLVQQLSGERQQGLPLELKQAYQRAIITSGPGATMARPAVSRLKVAAIAAAVVVLAITAFTLLPQLPGSQLRQARKSEMEPVYKLVSAPVPPPQIKHDTIYLERVATRIVYRTRYDTVERVVLEPPQLVYLRDTLYLPTPVDEATQLVKSKPAAREPRLLELLTETD